MWPNPLQVNILLNADISNKQQHYTCINLLFQYYLAPDIDVENGIEGDGEECESEEEDEEEDGADDGDEGGEGEEGDDSIVVVEDDVDEDDDEDEAVNDEDDGVNEEDDLLGDDDVDREGKRCNGL